MTHSVLEFGELIESHQVSTEKPRIQGYIEFSLWAQFEAERSVWGLSQSQAVERMLSERYKVSSNLELGESLSYSVELELKEINERLNRLEKNQIRRDYPSEIFSQIVEEVNNEVKNQELPGDSDLAPSELPSELPGDLDLAPSELPSELPGDLDLAPSELPSELPGDLDLAPSDLPILDYLDGLPSELPSDLDLAPSGLPSELPGDLDLAPSESPGGLPSELPGDLDLAPSESPGELPSDLDLAPSESPKRFASKAKLEKGLGRLALGRRLGTTGTILEDLNVLGNLEKWSAQHDPQGLAWELRDGKYYPKSLQHKLSAL